ncbi:MAG TPA: diguanylate cyclase [Gemmatimonadaceae bacterium]|nr:diguanylate cyclase [Gemmatimonadaceae bacterium]
MTEGTTEHRPSRRTYLPVPRLDSIRSRILAFAVLATLVPAGLTVGISYVQNRRALEDKITQELLSESSQAARAMGVWVKERIYDLRVFAGSDEVANSLDGGARTPRQTRVRLRDYLVSLHERFRDYEQLLVLDLQGNTLATSATELHAVTLPADWTKALQKENQFIGDPYVDPKTKKTKLIVAVPVQRADGRLLGAFAAELSVAPVEELLRSFAPDSNGTIFLVSTNGAVIASSKTGNARAAKKALNEATLQRLTNLQSAAVPYQSVEGQKVVGTLKPVPQLRWAVLAEVDEESAFRQVRRYRNVSLLVIGILLIIVSAAAYRFGVLIVRPLDRLAKGAAEVSAGDLAVDLPEGGGGEVGYLTGVFNQMVSSLRESRRELDDINDRLRTKNEELERLSITDGLTGLANHRFLMQRLGEEATRSDRTDRAFSVMMADVDHFKQYNDEFGHPAGDEVLKQVAAVLRDCTRTVDCVGRYGGEEFAIIMPETAIEGATTVAERIRARVASAVFPNRRITLSIGVAEYKKENGPPQATLAIADEGLYEAKRGGRNRVSEAKKTAKKR